MCVGCHVHTLQEHPGIITMSSTADHGQKSVLMLATVRDSSVKLLELPTFAERGVLPDVSSFRCFGVVQEGLRCGEPSGCDAMTSSREGGIPF